MKKIISILVITFLWITSILNVNAENSNNDVKILSNWTKNVNNMKCDYIEVSYDDYYKMTFEDWIAEKRNFDLDKIKLSNIENFNFNDRSDVKEDLKNSKEKYVWNSSSIDISIPLRMSWFYSIFKDWKYIYNAEKSKYFKNWTFWFIHNAYWKKEQSWFWTYFIFSNCKEIITSDYQTSLNKTLKVISNKADTSFSNDEEKRVNFYDNLIWKVEKISNSKISQKNKFILEYLKEGLSYYKNKKYEYLKLYDWETENIWYSDFIN
jgi:hypothetical protein